MDIRDAQEEIELRYIDNGDEICCPICGIVWLREVEGEFTSGTCEHLRFTLHSECCDGFEFFNEWDTEGLIDLVEKARKNDEDIDILDILGEAQHPDVNRAIFHEWQEDPLNHPWALWGYKN